MYVDPEHRVCYLAHPKTASQATAWALTHRLSFVRLGSHHGGPGETDRTLGGDWTVFTTVRNHFDALCSWRRSLGDRPPMTPEGWRRWFHTEGISYVDCLSDDWRLWWHVGRATRVLRFEDDLDRQIGDVLEEAGLPRVELPGWFKRSADAPHYRDVIGPDLRAWVESTFAGEMAELDYSW